jgi:tetratricopeptide (TPR) repeat protein
MLKLFDNKVLFRLAALPVVFMLVANSGTTLAPNEAQGSVTPRKPQPNEISAYRQIEESFHAATPEAGLQMHREALAMVPEPTQIRGQFTCMFAARLLEYDRARKERYSPELVTTADECYRLLPDSADAQQLAGIVKLESGQPRVGGLLLIKSIKSNPKIILATPIDVMQRIMRTIGYADENAILDELRLTLVNAGFARDNQAFYGELALEAISAHVASKQSNRAIALLPQILDSDSGLKLLIDRRFESIWPAVEEWAANTLERQRDVNLKAVKARYELDPSLENRRVYADGLLNSGKLAEASALLRAAIDDPKLWDDDRFHISMLVVRYAKILAVQNRAEEGIAIATRVNKANPVAQFPYAANLMPNLARFLINSNRYQEALDLITREYPLTRQVENDASFGFYVALRFCAFRGLGQTALAAEQSALLVAKYPTNKSALNISESCKTDAASARLAWTGFVLNPETRGRGLLLYYRIKYGSGMGITDDYATQMNLVREDPELLRLFEKYGRRLPESYLPAINYWIERPIK